MFSSNFALLFFDHIQIFITWTTFPPSIVSAKILLLYFLCYPTIYTFDLENSPHLTFKSLHRSARQWPFLAVFKLNKVHLVYHFSLDPFYYTPMSTHSCFNPLFVSPFTFLSFLLSLRARRVLCLPMFDFIVPNKVFFSSVSCYSSLFSYTKGFQCDQLLGKQFLIYPSNFFVSQHPLHYIRGSKNVKVEWNLKTITSAVIEKNCTNLSFF